MKLKNVKLQHKLLTIAITAAMAISLTACGKTAGTSSTQASNAASNSKILKIGVIQIAPHASLDNCYKGLVEGLAAAGYEVGKNISIDYQNAQGEPANCDLIAKNMVASKYDMIVGIATPSAMSAYSAAKDTNIPIVFSAVSDPVAAGIVKSLEKPEYNVTGTSDVLPLESQMKMIRAYLPNAKKIRILYTTSEPNSVTHLAKFKALAAGNHFEIVSIGVTNASEVGTAAASLVAKGVDCINNFTDNNVVNNLTTVLNAANNAKIPVFGSEVEQVKKGCLASEGIDYVSLGRETGKIAAKILKGEAKAGEIPVALISASEPVYNQGVLKTLGITMPDAYKTSANVGE